MIFDTHADILTDISQCRKIGMKNIFKNRHLENLKNGKVKAGIFVIWIDPYTVDDTREEMIQTLKYVSCEVLESKELFKIIKNKDDFKADTDEKQIQMIMGVEGLKCIGGDLEFLELLYMYGVRHVSLTWNEANELATGVDGNKDRGLTTLGEEAIKKLESLNIIVDVSHANEKTFWDIIEISKKPVIASHSNCKTICDHKRNLTDNQIKAIGQNGGFIGVNIHKNFVSKHKELQNIDTLINHIDHIVKLIGINHIGFGFDFCEYLDEGENTNIKGLINVSKVQDIIVSLKRRGYSENDIEKISYKNFEDIINKLL